MNRYLENLQKIEFVITYACTGKCRHCSEGDHSSCGEHIEPEIAAEAVRKIAREYPIRRVMTFGGEPMLYPGAVFEIMKAAREMNIPHRQIITNGYFSKDPVRIRHAAEGLRESGVNDILLSADAFHQETISLEYVKMFADEAVKLGIPLRIQPAWLVSHDDDNPYNRKTREILRELAQSGFSENEGNVIFPEGNALRYLGEYFTSHTPENPYIEDPYHVKCISFDPDGGVLGGNVYSRDIIDIMNDYKP